MNGWNGNLDRRLARVEIVLARRAAANAYHVHLATTPVSQMSDAEAVDEVRRLCKLEGERSVPRPTTPAEEAENGRA